MPAPRAYSAWDAVANSLGSSSDDDDNNNNDGTNRVLASGRERKLANELALEQARNALRPFVLVAACWDTRGEAARWVLDLFGKPHFDVVHTSTAVAAAWDGLLLNPLPPKHQRLLASGVFTNTDQTLPLSASRDDLLRFYVYLYANAAGIALASAKTRINATSGSNLPAGPTVPVAVPGTDAVRKTDDQQPIAGDDSTLSVLDETEFDDDDFLLRLQAHLDGEFYKACTTLFLSQVLTSDVLARKMLVRSTYDYTGLSNFGFPLVRMLLWIFHLGFATMPMLANGSTKMQSTEDPTCTVAQIGILETDMVGLAIAVVTSTFEKLGDIIKHRRNAARTSTSNIKFLLSNEGTGARFSTLDISFASHAVHCLLPDKVEIGEKLAVHSLTMKEVAPKLRTLYSAFRSSDAGKLAIHMYQKERKNTLEVSATRYIDSCKEAVPKFYVQSKEERNDIYIFITRVVFVFPAMYILVNIILHAIYGYQGIVLLTVNLLFSSMISPILVALLLFTVGFALAPDRIQERLHRLYFAIPLEEESIWWRLRNRLLLGANAVGTESDNYDVGSDATKLSDVALKKTL